MKKAFILIFSLLLTAAFVLSCAAVGAGGAFPEYGEGNSPFEEYSDEFIYPDINDKINDGVYTYGDDEYFDEYDDGLDEFDNTVIAFVTVGVLVSFALIILLIIFTVRVVKSSKKLKKYRSIESTANRGVMYYDPTGKIASRPDFTARQNGAYGYPGNNPNGSGFAYRKNDFDYQNGGFNGQNNGFNNQNGNNGVNGGVDGE